jgi:cellobiose phosphorylase
VADKELPLRAELLSTLQMEQHGRMLAHTHQTREQHGPDQLLPRLADNERVILQTCSQLTLALKAARQITPASEWLLDNFYLIEEQIRTAKQHLPKNYSKQLPRLLQGSGAGRPRVYEIALETIAHGDGRIDPEGLANFVVAYQQVTVLQLGELWAIPIMLRLALIENLRRVAQRLSQASSQRDVAGNWASQLMETAEKAPNRLILQVADMARAQPLIDSTFVAELVRSLQGQNLALSLPVTWLAQQLAETGHSIEQMVQLESQQQAADQVSISNSIGSLRLLGSTDWREFVENLSVVEQRLRQDPAQVHAQMDFSTRDHYRHVVETIARHGVLSELEVAEAALRFASAYRSASAQSCETAHGSTAESPSHAESQSSADLSPAADLPPAAGQPASAPRPQAQPLPAALPPEAHVGYYLIGQGRCQLERAASFRLPFWSAWQRRIGAAPLLLYLLGVVLLTALASTLFVWLASTLALGWQLLLGSMTLIATSQLALALVNWLATLISEPRPLPRMDFSHGIPASAKTLVVVPCMLFDNDSIDSLCEALEVRFLANRDPHLRFGLLSDWVDADSATLEQDGALLARAEANILALNAKYRDSGADNFLLLHRPRRYNAREQRWMGYERKRGKLADLNALLRSGSASHVSEANFVAAFSLIIANHDELAQVRYVITLDTDTELPWGTARKFVATMAHPLNQAQFDAKRKTVCQGYGILQPRIAQSLPASDASRYELLCGGEVGIDPYTRTVSDVYQDLFGEGSFIGKGIYDVDAFEFALKGRMPENRILSHDLLEGCHARAGLLSDVQLHEPYPSSYAADIARRQRWIRGDWQIASWLLPSVPSEAGQAGQPGQPGNPLSRLSRWKLFDNLRRSLVAPALTGLLLAGWWLLPHSALWTLAVMALLLIPAIFALAVNLLRKSADMLLHQHLASWSKSAGQHHFHAALTLIFLPYEAWSNLDAILRTNWRVLVSRRRLLEWNPSGRPAAHAQNGLSGYWRSMWISPALALAVALGLGYARLAALPVASPLLLLWGLAPWVAWWISQPILRPVPGLGSDQIRFLGTLARKTWLYFETHVTAQDNWLPPDNVQEYPVAVVAHRTSPTNIGLALLANLAACDFGYISFGECLQRTRRTLHSLSLLERHQGHFFNWYDTQQLKPLQPEYVSSVDSGNLAGHLLTLRPGLLAMLDAPILSPRLFQGLSDTCNIVYDSIAAPVPEAATAGAAAGAGGTMGNTLGNIANTLGNTLAGTLGGTLGATFSASPASPSGPANPSVSDPASASDGKDATWRSAWYQRLQPLSHCIALACQTERPNLLLAHDYLQQIHHLAQSLLAARNPASDPPTLSVWLVALARQVQLALDDLHYLMPWSLTLAPANWLQAGPQGVAIPSLRQLAQLSFVPPAEAADVPSHPEWPAMVQLASERAARRIQQVEQLALQAAGFARMEYGFLFDSTTHLLAIGYNLSERRRDTCFYDLLASEARLTTFIGIAQGQLPQESWFALGRQLTIADGAPILLSWSGSMFEYLMPLLVMPNFDNTLLHQTCAAAVARQIEYGRQRGVAWGISESGYYAFDASLNYQYRAFGVPGLGFKRGLGDDLVIAPYASMMALMVAPEAACLNLQAMAAQGWVGHFGFYEAVDYTGSRLPRGQNHAVIRSFMSHHQGMGFLALAHLLLDGPMQARFASDPLFQATMLLLHEKIPKASAHYANATELADIRTNSGEPALPMRIITRLDPRTPEVQLLSNGRYHVMLTSAGGGYSRWNELALNRWREDGTRDNWGSFCYLRDIESGQFWSTTLQPTLAVPDSYEAIFTEGRAEYRRSDHQFTLHTEVVVSPEDDIELRRVRIVNRARYRRSIEITSFAEVVLAPAAADAMHPAFSNLFVQTEIIAQQHAIVASRRPRSEHEKNPLLFHLMALHGATIDAVSYETDRMQFIGRGNSSRAPLALQRPGPLGNSQGSVLDPVLAIRYLITLDPEQSATLDMVTGVADTRAACHDLIEKYRDRHLAERVVELSWTHSQVMLRQLGASEADTWLYGRLANSVIFTNPLLRADAAILARNQRGQSGLWSSAISGDLPIVLLHIKRQESIELARQLVQAHAWWRLKGLVVDLVIWNGEHNGYRQVLQEQILRLVASVTGPHAIDRPGGIFLRMSDQVATEDRILFQAVARVVLSDDDGTLSEQINRRELAELRPPKLFPGSDSAAHRSATPGSPLSLAGSASPVAASGTALSGPSGASGAAGASGTSRPSGAAGAFAGSGAAAGAYASPHADSEKLLLGNGIGGFSPDGREYHIHTGHGQTTPAPWANVLANPQFGSVVSESGQAYTWGENAHEFRLTPWANDPVSDIGGEAFYLRDEETGHYWSPTPLPCRGSGPYLTRHGFGYSVFEHDEGGIVSELTVFVAQDSAVKYSLLRVHNRSGRVRKLSATGYVEWVLGDLRPKSAMHIVTEIDPASQAMLARNHYNSEFAQNTAFFEVDAAQKSSTADRLEFIGRNRSLQDPAALERVRLSGKIGAGLDPCAALMVPFELKDGQEREWAFMLGMADTRRSDDVSQLIRRCRGVAAAHAALKAVHDWWRDTLGRVQVRSPEPAFDVMANGWLLYQTIACRLWARSGYYQSGGAFGFRDQLQDCMALVHHQPRFLRDQLLLCAAHQFIEGDVQHWWHPPTGRGVRTHCSDDFLWLPLALTRYVQATDDRAILDEVLPFIEGRALNPDEDSYYDRPQASSQSASLYQHAQRALQHGLRFGSHGLCLIGSCDWNDGMDKVGDQGRGESVWLSMFLYYTLNRFGVLARQHGDAGFADFCVQEAARLKGAIDEHGWDGAWYRRAYFDDGTPLGSAQNVECQIDAIAQSWSVLSGLNEPQRAQQAMAALEQRLVRPKDGIIQLLDPPFDQSGPNPGYIRGYVPGVRENGGQYTHAAIWAAMAFAEMGEPARAWDLLRMINPVNHGNSADKIAVYRVEPYVVAADVYGMAPHVGRGGWSWYTGSSGWLLRLMLESLLGLRRQGAQLHLAPQLPPEWPGLEIDYRYLDTEYKIVISQQRAADQATHQMAAPQTAVPQPDGEQTPAPRLTVVAQLTLDGVLQQDGVIRLVDDRQTHQVAYHMVLGGGVE